MAVRALSNDALHARLSDYCREGRKVLASIVECLIEVEDRDLHADRAYPSLYDYCTRGLGMSDGEACRRINAARLARRFPAILPRIADGSLHLSALMMLRDRLTNDNHEELLAAAAGKSKSDIEALIAELWPKPDVPSRITKLPGGPREELLDEVSAAGLGEAAGRLLGASSRFTPLAQDRHRVQFTASGALRAKLERARDLMRHRNRHGDLAVVVEAAVDLLLAKLERERLGKTSRPRGPAHPRRNGCAASTAGATSAATEASPGAAAKSSPGEAAKSPPDDQPPCATGPAAVAHAPRRAESRTIPQHVRRAVFERDGEQCTYRDASGNRCPSTTFLELDHIDAHARGGKNTTTNLRVRCMTHNLDEARRVFGREHVLRKQHERWSQGIVHRLTQLGFPDSIARGAAGAVCARRRGGPLPSFGEALDEAVSMMRRVPVPVPASASAPRSATTPATDADAGS